MIEKTTTPATKVTMDVEELAALVKHAEQSVFWYNMPRSPDQFHRCLQMRFIDYPEPEVRFELQHDNRLVAVVAHKVSDLFDLLPRLRAMLVEYNVTAQVAIPAMTKDTAGELYALLTGYRISGEAVSDGVSEFIEYLDREIRRHA